MEVGEHSHIIEKLWESVRGWEILFKMYSKVESSVLDFIERLPKKKNKIT